MQERRGKRNDKERSYKPKRQNARKYKRGLKAKGHPISATGVSQIYELVKQMRDQAGERQVDGVKYALAQNVGGAGSTVTVHILKNV